MASQSHAFYRRHLSVNSKVFGCTETLYLLQVVETLCSDEKIVRQTFLGHFVMFWHCCSVWQTHWSSSTSPTFCWHVDPRRTIAVIRLSVGLRFRQSSLVNSFTVRFKHPDGLYTPRGNTSTFQNRPVSWTGRCICPKSLSWTRAWGFHLSIIN